MKKRNEVRIVFTTTVVDLVPEFGKSFRFLLLYQCLTTKQLNKLIKKVVRLTKTVTETTTTGK